jgi:hypothetical protein
MKLPAALLIVLSIVGDARAQHPLVGTWEMVSIAGVNADGEKFSLDTSSIREIKIITPTHYILIAEDKDSVGWAFNRSYAGTVRMNGDKYIESPILSSLQLYDNVITDFNWSVNGSTFVQTGKITRPDGKVIVLDRFEFRRNAIPPHKGPNPFLGTWSLADEPDLKGLLVINPSHWMFITKAGEKFSAAGGTYTLSGDSATLTVLYGSPNHGAPPKISIDKSLLTFGKQTFKRAK